MERSEKFINWLEGFLDASKNKINSGQVREIRKKIKEYHDQERNDIIPIYDTLAGLSNSGYGDLLNTSVIKESEKNAEYLKEIEKNKAASTMEQLVD